MKITNSQMATLTNTESTQNTSEKYTVIKTIDVLDKFKAHGFTVSAYEESRVRNQDRFNKMKHFVRMKIDGSTGCDREIVIMNSHDGTSSLKLNFGLFNYVCQNQLVFGDSLLPTEKIYHSMQNPWDKIDAYAELVLTKLREEEELRKHMENLRLSAYDIEQFAYQAIATREKDMSIILDPMAVTLARRPEDNSKMLWQVYNKIQENVIKADSYRKLSIVYDEKGEATEKYRVAKKLTDHGRILTTNKSIHEIAMNFC